MEILQDTKASGTSVQRLFDNFVTHVLAERQLEALFVVRQNRGHPERGRGRKTIFGGADFRFSAGAMFFGSRAELFEKSRKSENFFRIDLSNSRDFFNSESLAQHF